MAVSGLLLMAVRTAPSLSNVKKPNVTYQSMTGVTVVLSLQLNKSGQKGKICWVTSKAQKSVGTITGRNQAMEIPKYRLKNTLSSLFPKLSCYFLTQAARTIRKEQLYTFFCQSHIEKKDVKGKRKSCPKKMGIKEFD